MNNEWPEMMPHTVDLADLSDRQLLQREQDHFGFIVIGGDVQAEAGDIIEGINVGSERIPAPDIKVHVIGLSNLAEWRQHVLFNYGQRLMAEFDAWAAHHRTIVRAIAE